MNQILKLNLLRLPYNSASAYKSGLILLYLGIFMQLEPRSLHSRPPRPVNLFRFSSTATAALAAPSCVWRAVFALGVRRQAEPGRAASLTPAPFAAAGLSGSQSSPEL